MEPKSPTCVKIAACTVEMGTIFRANAAYWRRGASVTREERSDYQHRLERLEEIRAELTQLLT
jgi:hypothetical protein